MVRPRLICRWRYTNYYYYYYFVLFCFYIIYHSYRFVNAVLTGSIYQSSCDDPLLMCGLIAISVCDISLVMAVVHLQYLVLSDILYLFSILTFTV